MTRLVESIADERCDDDDLDTTALAAAQASATMAALPNRRTASLVGGADQHSSQPTPDHCASGGGFSLNANVSLWAHDRKGLLRLIATVPGNASASTWSLWRNDGRQRVCSLNATEDVANQLQTTVLALCVTPGVTQPGKALDLGPLHHGLGCRLKLDASGSV